MLISNLSGWVGGRINWKYNHLSPQLGLGLGAELGNIDETGENALVDGDNTTNGSDESTLGDINTSKHIDEETLGDEKGSKSNNGEEHIDGERNDDEKKEVTREVEGGNIQTRRSERIKKQRVEIHPDDIGDNDDENDETYK